MLKVILKYGLIAGLAIVGYLNLLYETGILYSQSFWANLGTLTIVIMPVVIFFALRELKKKHYGGAELPLIPATVSGVSVAMLGMLIYCLADYINVHYLDLRMDREMIELTTEDMRQQGKSAEEIAQTETEMRAHYMSVTPYLNTLTWYLKWGAIYTLVAYFLLNFKHFKNKWYDKKVTKNGNSA